MRNPATGMETPSPRATSGKTPAMTNSAVPKAKAARKSASSGKDMVTDGQGMEMPHSMPRADGQCTICRSSLRKTIAGGQLARLREGFRLPRVSGCGRAARRHEMAVSSQTKRRFALATALRGLLMLLGGIYAVIWPLEALAVLVLFGGILLIIDGALGLWSLTFGGGKSGNYWFDVVANAASLILGVLILISPFLATIFTVTFMSTLVGIAAIIIGVMQIVVVVRERESYARIW